MNLQEIKPITKYFLLAVTAFTTLLISCRHDGTKKLTPTQISLVQLVVGDGTNMFRKTALGADAKMVLASERKKPDENDTNYLYYTLPMDTLFPDSVNDEVDTLNYFTIACSFDQQKLSEINEVVLLATDSAAASLYTRLNDYLTTKYGDGMKDRDQTIWKIKKMGDKTAKVSLSDESYEVDYGKLSLVYYLE